MIHKLKGIKKLRKKRKLIAEEKLKKLEESYELKNNNNKIVLKMENIKSEINQLEKDLENLNDLEKKFKQEDTKI